MAWVATAIIGAGAVGAAATAYSANVAADAQKNAAAQAANTSLSMYNSTKSTLAPFTNLGAQAADYTSKNLSSLIAPVNVDTSILNDPNSTIGRAYNFINDQGQRAVTNSAAARGLGTSGAALKGAATFATNTADTFYNDLFNMGVTNQTNAFNRLNSLIQTGENAGALTGSAGTAAAGTAASAEIAGGNAAAAGANATGGAVNTFANNIGGYAAYKGLYGTPNNPTNNYIGSMPATGPFAPPDSVSNAYAQSQGINPYA